MIVSYAIYIGMLVLCWFLAYCANRYNSKHFVRAIVLLLTCFAGLRAHSVGWDTSNYITKFEVIEKGNFDLAYGLETSFKYICYVLLKFFNNTTFLLIVFALITNLFIIYRLWDFRKLASFSCVVSCYYMGFYFMTMNGMRQFCALAITFYATRYLPQKKYFRFILLVLVAALFHQSAIVGILPLGLELFHWKSLDRKQRRFMGLMICAIPFALVGGYMLLMRYERYFQTVSFDIGYMVLLKVLFFLFMVFFVFKMQGVQHHYGAEISIQQEDKENLLLISFCYFAGLCLATLGYIFPYADRISWYFYIFEGLFMGVLMKDKTPINKLIVGLCISGVMGYNFIYSMINNSQGTMPYMFFWQ